MTGVRVDRQTPRNTAPISAGTPCRSLILAVVHLLQRGMPFCIFGEVIAHTVRGIFNEAMDVLPRVVMAFESMPGRS